jgi:hypothetical protein
MPTVEASRIPWPISAGFVGLPPLETESKAGGRVTVFRAGRGLGSLPPETGTDPWRREQFPCQTAGIVRQHALFQRFQPREKPGKSSLERRKKPFVNRRSPVRARQLASAFARKAELRLDGSAFARKTELRLDGPDSASPGSGCFEAHPLPVRLTSVPFGRVAGIENRFLAQSELQEPGDSLQVAVRHQTQPTLCAG